MSDIERARENLKIIYKNGDLYNVIANKLTVRPRKNSFIKANVLLFSRLAFLGVLIGERIASLFSPIERVRKAG